LRELALPNVLDEARLAWLVLSALAFLVLSVLDDGSFALIIVYC
jgi:hypothetical protein